MVCYNNGWLIGVQKLVTRVSRKSRMKRIGHDDRKFYSCALDSYFCDPSKFRTSCEERGEKQNILMNVSSIWEIKRNIASMFSWFQCSMATRRKAQIWGTTQMKKYIYILIKLVRVFVLYSRNSHEYWEK